MLNPVGCPPLVQGGFASKWKKAAKKSKKSGLSAVEDGAGSGAKAEWAPLPDKASAGARPPSPAGAWRTYRSAIPEVNWVVPR